VADPRIEIAKLLLAQDDDVTTAEVLLRRMLDLTGADRGFVVVREGDQYSPKFAVRFDAAGTDAASLFSRNLVRTALTQNRLVHSLNPAEDPELAGLESLAASAGRAVVVVPLSSSEERFGALYLEHPRAGGFTEEAIALLGDISELAGLCIHGAVQRAELARRSSSLERDLFARYDFAGIVTRHPSMLALLEMVGQVADAKAAVLIRGESGTGKELVAQALHVNSERRRGPFVALHCAALPSTMVESELFGHTRGAFTGADRDRAGRFASANGGTLFLDEVAEISLETQAKLLRAIQSGEIQRVGSDRIERVQVRVVAATHVDLAERVSRGAFRQDLYYRLRVVELKLPPLRERRSDIALLVQHFLREQGALSKRVPRAVLRAFEAHDWPGNVRELAHAVERACLLSRGEEIDPDSLPEELQRPAPPRPVALAAATEALGAAGFERFDKDELETVVASLVARAERDFVEGLLTKHGGNVTRAAQESGIHRSQLQKLMARVRS
jgi:Nif-specific regulatory protein/two-component system response regulator HydG